MREALPLPSIVLTMRPPPIVNRDALFILRIGALDGIPIAAGNQAQPHDLRRIVGVNAHAISEVFVVTPARGQARFSGGRACVAEVWAGRSHPLFRAGRARPSRRFCDAGRRTSPWFR